MTAVKYELNDNCLSQSISKSGLQDVVRRTIVKCEQYIGLMQLIIVNRIRNGNVQSDTGYCTFTDTNALNSALYCN